MPPDARLRALSERIAQTSFSHKRRLIALAGAPASGKSTLAHALCALVPGACVVPMDGFHLDNALLEARGLLARKGAPETFDARGFLHLMYLPPSFPPSPPSLPACPVKKPRVT